jgi:hypothetical protein
MNMVASSTIKKIEEKAEKTEEDKKNYEIYKNGCDLVSMDYLKDVIAWYRSRKY